MNPTDIYGSVYKEFDFGVRRLFVWTFIIADVRHVIIGADLFTKYNLLLVLTKKLLIDQITNQ